MQLYPSIFSIIGYAIIIRGGAVYHRNDSIIFASCVSAIWHKVAGVSVENLGYEDAMVDIRIRISDGALASETTRKISDATV